MIKDRAIKTDPMIVATRAPETTINAEARTATVPENPKAKPPMVATLPEPAKKGPKEENQETRGDGGSHSAQTTSKTLESRTSRRTKTPRKTRTQTAGRRRCRQARTDRKTTIKTKIRKTGKVRTKGKDAKTLLVQGSIQNSEWNRLQLQKLKVERSL